MRSRLTLTSSTSPSGFSLVELIIVMVLISVLVSMLLPAVGSVRVAAQRTQCKNNIGQISIALANYEMLYGAYPAGAITTSQSSLFQTPAAAQGPSQPVLLDANSSVSWLVAILPQLDQPRLYRKFDLHKPIDDPANDTPRKTYIPVLMCPTDQPPTFWNWPPPKPAPAAGAAVPGRKGAQSSYSGSHHHTEAPIASDNTGVFVLNRPIHHQQIPDGLSCTIFTGEKLTSPGDNGWAVGDGSTLRNGSLSGWTQTGKSWSGAAAAPGGPGFVGGFGSSHAGGFQVALGDGSVRFLSQVISPEVLASLCQRDDGEMLPEF